MGAPYFETKPEDLARVFQLFAGKSGGKAAFGVVGLSVRGANGDGRPSIAVEHRGKMDIASLKAEWFGATIDPSTSFDVATDYPNRVLDYLAPTLFEPGTPIRVAYDSDGKRIVFHDGYHRATMGTVAFDTVSRPSRADGVPLFGPAPNGLWVVSNPARRPKDPMTWGAWSAAGYTVAKIPLATLAKVAFSGELLFGHNYKGTLHRFDVHEDGIEVTITDPKNPDAEDIHYDRLPGVTLVSSPSDSSGNESFLVAHSSVRELWEPLNLLQCESLMLVHHPAEQTINLLAAEDAPSGTPILRFTESFMAWHDPRVKKAEKK